MPAAVTARRACGLVTARSASTTALTAATVAITSSGVEPKATKSGSTLTSSAATSREEKPSAAARAPLETASARVSQPWSGKSPIRPAAPAKISSAAAVSAFGPAPCVLVRTGTRWSRLS